MFCIEWYLLGVTLVKSVASTSCLVRHFFHILFRNKKKTQRMVYITTMCCFVDLHPHTCARAFVALHPFFAFANHSQLYFIILGNNIKKYGLYESEEDTQQSSVV